MQQPLVTFVHISDTHLGPERDTAYHGFQPFPTLERLVSLINAFPQPPDFVLHTGDLVNDRSAASVALAAEALEPLNVPLVLVNGNHDARGLLRAQFDLPADPDGDPDAPLDYVYEIKGERFLVLDGWTREVPDPQGKLSAAQIARVRAEAASDGPRFTVLLHYPPFPMGSPWLDANMPLVNGDELHAALLPARDRLRGVFFGHMHRTCHIVRDGITYTGAPSALYGYLWRPWDERPIADFDLLPAYNIVQYFADQVVMQQYVFPRP